MSKGVVGLMKDNDYLREQVKQLTEEINLLRSAYDHVASQLRADGHAELCDSISEFHKHKQKAEEWKRKLEDR